MTKNTLVTQLLFGAAAAACGLLGAGQANATTMPNGSFSGALIGGTVTTTYAGGSAWQLGTTTTQIQIAGGSREISGAANPYLGNPDNMLNTNGGPVTVGDAFTVSTGFYDVSNGAVTPFTVAVDGLTFTMTSEIVKSLVNGNIGLAFLGTLTGDTSTSTNSPFTLGSAADFSVGFTESAPAGAIGVADSIDAPPNPAILPEPTTLAVLGIGLVGLVGARRKSRSFVSCNSEPMSPSPNI